MRGSFSGKVIGGTIVNTGENIFRVTARLRLKKGGAGDVIVIGDLDHNDLPQPLKETLFRSSFLCFDLREFPLRPTPIVARMRLKSKTPSIPSEPVMHDPICQGKLLPNYR